MRLVRKSIIAVCMLGCVFAALLVVAWLIRGNDDYLWIINNGQVGVKRTDTNQTVMLQNFHANVMSDTPVLESRKDTGVIILFHDQTITPGRVTFKFDGRYYDVMSRALIVNGEEKMWE